MHTLLSTFNWHGSGPVDSYNMLLPYQVLIMTLWLHRYNRCHVSHLGHGCFALELVASIRKYSEVYSGQPISLSEQLIYRPCLRNAWHLF